MAQLTGLSGLTPLGAGSLSISDPTKISGLTAWYRADQLTSNGTAPNTVSGCVAWYRADRGITLNGSTVANWADSSAGASNTHILSQSTGAKQPAFTASDSAYNNQPTLTFDGSNDFMASPTWAASLAV